MEEEALWFLEEQEGREGREGRDTCSEANRLIAQLHHVGNLAELPESLGLNFLLGDRRQDEQGEATSHLQLIKTGPIPLSQSEAATQAQLLHSRVCF